MKNVTSLSPVLDVSKNSNYSKLCAVHYKWIILAEEYKKWKARGGKNHEVSGAGGGGSGDEWGVPTPPPPPGKMKKLALILKHYSCGNCFCTY